MKKCILINIYQLSAWSYVYSKKIINNLPSSAMDSVESKGLPPWFRTDSNFWPNDKCRMIWVVLNDEDENGCTSWTKILKIKLNIKINQCIIFSILKLTAKPIQDDKSTSIIIIF